MFLSCSYSTSSTNDAFTARCADRADTERTIRILVAILYAVKYHLRSDWGAVITPGTAMNSSPANATFDHQEYDDLLPAGLVGMDDKGLGLPLQLTFFVEQYIKRGHDKGWFHAPQASQMQVQLSKMVDAYGRMETIRLTPIPVAHLYVLFLSLLSGNPHPQIPYSENTPSDPSPPTSPLQGQQTNPPLLSPTASTRNKSSPSSAWFSPSPWSTKWAGGLSPSSPS